jgi:hypothetical protein
MLVEDEVSAPPPPNLSIFIKIDVCVCVCVCMFGHNFGTPGAISTKLGTHIAICMCKNFIREFGDSRC